MKKRGYTLIWTIFCCIHATLLMGQGPPASSVNYYQLYSQSSESTEFQRFITRLENKRANQDEREFLQYVFAKTHRKFLKTYEGNADFAQLSQGGFYNCLTGTALYALILNHFGFDYKIIETNYHIFLVVNSRGGSILFEATDPVNGFLADAAAIQKRVAKYRENKPLERVTGNYYYYTFNLFNEVSLQEMEGLLHYNEAVEAFNEHQVAYAIHQLDKAIKLYQSPRIDEFSKLVLLSVVQSKMDTSVKELYVRKIQSIRNQKVPGITSPVTEN